MKKTHLKIGLLSACLLSIGSVASAQSCGAESCDSTSCKCTRKNCDDRGLLEVINNAASNFEAKLASMIPDRDHPRAKAKCNCDKCSAPSDFAIHYTEVSPSRPVAPHIIPPLAQPDIARPPKPRVMAPANPIVDPIPVPHSGTQEAIPLPDTRNDPFKDDPTTRNLRPVPARPTSYLRSSQPQVEYDPQASNQKSMRSILISKAASKSISDSTYGLAKSSSTRRVQSHGENTNVHVEPSVFEQAAPEVVPASLFVPLPNARKLPSTPAETAESFVNPLRAQ